MKYFLKTLLLIAMLAGGSSVANAGKFSTVIIDPGHGGRDLGGSYGKVYEKHLALDTSFRLNYILRKKGYSTKILRTSDVFITLAKRAQISNSNKNAIFVSIHYNWTYKSHVNGVETFYHGSRSKPLAQYIHSGILKKYRAHNRGVKSARYYVLRHNKNPAVIVEGGFLSNYSERMRCMKGWYRQKVAEGIADGIDDYQKARRKGWCN